MSAQQFVTDLLAEADIQINGSRPWDLRVLDQRVFNRIVEEGCMGFGESFMEGWIDCDSVDQMVNRAYRAQLSEKIDKKDAFFAMIKAKAATLGSRARSFDIGKNHYDIGNDLYQLMLDQYMIYSCGYWKRADTLAQAQQDKLEITCRKLQLEPGMRVLDIGCGWGGFAKYAAEKYKVNVVGITVSREQLALGEQLCADLPIKLRYQDYRDVDEQFDRIVSIGMFEHVGHKFYEAFFETTDRCLKKDGLFVLHTVGYTEEDFANPWYDKYIMPGVAFPSLSQILKCTESRFILEDFHNWEGSHYDKTLMAWYDSFEAGRVRLSNQYDDTFCRMWKLYLQGCAGAFRANRMRVWQLVFTKQPIPGGYSYAPQYPLD